MTIFGLGFILFSQIERLNGLGEPRRRTSAARAGVARYSRGTMTELSPDQIRALAVAAGLPVSDDDLAEVTHRVNAFVEALGPLAALPLESVEPLPVAPETD